MGHNFVDHFDNLRVPDFPSPGTVCSGSARAEIDSARARILLVSIQSRVVVVDRNVDVVVTSACGPFSISRGRDASSANGSGLGASAWYRGRLGGVMLCGVGGAVNGLRARLGSAAEQKFCRP